MSDIVNDNLAASRTLPALLLRCAGSLALCCAAAVASAQSAVESTTGANSAGEAGAPAWSIRFPSQDPVPFRGLANLDDAGFAGMPMIYPGYGPGMFLGAILAHGLTTAAARQAQKTEMQRTADQVLVPYQDVLSAFTHERLRTRLRGESRAGPATGTDAWEIESAPVFALTADQTALVMENTLAVRRAGSPPDAPPSYVNAIKVVSQRIGEKEPLPYWTADDGKRLQETSASLLQESIDIAIATAAAAAVQSPQPSESAVAVQRTYRYWEGMLQKMERAELIADRCSRMVLRTLRGTLLSIPVSTDNRDCTLALEAKATSASN